MNAPNADPMHIQYWNLVIKQSGTKPKLAAKILTTNFDFVPDYLIYPLMPCHWHAQWLLESYTYFWRSMANMILNMFSMKGIV